MMNVNCHEQVIYAHPTHRTSTLNFFNIEPGQACSEEQGFPSEIQKTI